MRLLLAPSLSLALIGCNLATDLDAYPYTGAVIVDLDEGSDGMDMPSPVDMPSDGDMLDMPKDLGPDLEADLPDLVDMEQDMEPLRLRIRFTEVMADSSMDGGAELGEYIEVTNVGEVAIDPRYLQIELVAGSQTISVDLTPDDAAEQGILSGLKMIMPGQAFVFVRRDTPAFGITKGLPAGTFYEYERWGATPNIGLSNSTRSIRLLYPDPQTQLPAEQDYLSWAGGDLVDPRTEDSDFPLPMVEDVAWSLDPFWYELEGPSESFLWCYEPNKLTGTRLVRGSPGAPMAGDECVREVLELPP